MKELSLRRLSALLIALAFATPVLADPAPGTIMKVAPPAERTCGQNYKVQLVHLTQLGGALNLTPTQKPLFEAWRKARLELWSGEPCPPPPTGLDVPVPRRVENQLAMVSATEAGLRKELPAIQALYNALTPEQRTIFDGPVKLSAPH